MIKKISLLLSLFLGFTWAQADNNSRDERLKRRQQEELQRLDEYANDLRRRDWLKDRLILEVGLGSKFPAMGETGFGFGVGAEYITRWHVSLFGAYGIIPSRKDEAFENITLDGGTGYRFGVGYYLFPKNPLHLGFAASYGTVYFDHNKEQVEDAAGDGTRALIQTNGFEFDATITFLTDQWYFLQFVAGMYYIPSGELNKKSWQKGTDGKDYSVVVNEDGIPDKGLVFGLAIGFALPEFFPDDTEVRRRERERNTRHK